MNGSRSNASPASAAARWVLLSALALCMAPEPLLAQEPAPEKPAASGPDYDALRGALRQAIQTRVSGNEASSKIQEKIDVLADETDALNSQYRATLKQVEAIEKFNISMRELVDSQTAELESVAGQLDRVEEVGRNVLPLMLRMIDALQTFVELDIPFLYPERTARIANLRDLMERADLSSATKFRQIMEAYQTENEYGRTIEAYRGKVTVGGRDLIADQLRFGRISLVFQSLDGDTTGVWNRQKGAWELLDASFAPQVRRGLRIARKLEPPDLIEIPLLPPREMGPLPSRTDVADAADTVQAEGSH